LNTEERSAELPVSRILQRVSAGEVRAAEELLPLVYDELRRLAAARMQRESVDHTLQPTALVHEAYLRLVRNEPQTWDNRRHFFSAAAEAMRRILIEHARSRDRLKRGGEAQREPLAEIAINPSIDLSEVIAVHEILDEFERLMPDKAELVKLRYFVGLDEAAAAETLGISRPTASRWWTFSRAWLFQKLSERNHDERQNST
jgi:RNA polymerase sigma factor (TIGR02999 family)